MKRESIRRMLAAFSTMALVCAMPLAAGVLSASGETAVIKVACIGDSVTWGVGGTSYPQQLGQKLGSSFQVKNFGISGSCAQNNGHDQNPSDPKKFGYRTCNPAVGDWNYNDVYQNIIPDIAGSAGKTKYEQSLLYKADVYIISIGGNDAKACNWNKGSNSFEADYRALIQEYLDLPWHPIVIIGTSPAGVKDSYSLSCSTLENNIVPIQRKVAAEMQLPLVDTFTPTKGKTAYYIEDGVHLNTQGYGVIASAYYAAFKSEADGYQYNFDEISRYTGGVGVLSVPERLGVAPIKKIGNGAFNGSETLAGVAIPDGVTTIGKLAFADCKLLCSVCIPASVTAIGDQAFDGAALVTIYGEKDSYAAQYAKDNNIPFVEGDVPELYAESGMAVENKGETLGGDTELKVVKSSVPANQLGDGYKAGLWFGLSLNKDKQPVAAGTFTVYLSTVTMDSTRCEVFRVEDGDVYTPVAATEKGGVFTFTETALGNYVVKEKAALPGDVDGDSKISTTDARLTLQYTAQKIDETALNLTVADVDGDEKVTTTDARLILQKAAQKLDLFPVEK